jgi:hypothetical protein
VRVGLGVGDELLAVPICVRVEVMYAVTVSGPTEFTGTRMMQLSVVARFTLSVLVRYRSNFGCPRHSLCGVLNVVYVPLMISTMVLVDVTVVTPLVEL